MSLTISQVVLIRGEMSSLLDRVDTTICLSDFRPKRTLIPIRATRYRVGRQSNKSVPNHIGTFG